MTLKELQNGMIAAMKQGNKLKKDVLSSAIAAIKKAAIDKGCRDNIDEELVNTTLLKEQKILQEQLDTCPEDRQELRMAYTLKLEYLKKYVPQLISNENEIRKMIAAALESAGVEATRANKGIVMKTVMPTLKGKVDMKIANKVIGEILV